MGTHEEIRYIIETREGMRPSRFHLHMLKVNIAKSRNI